MGEATVLLPVIQMLVLARELSDVREAIGHGIRIISRYESLALFERRGEGELELTLRSGAEVGPAGQLLEQLLAKGAVQSGATASTLDRVDDPALQARLDEHVSAGRLCLARPLCAYGELVGALVLHFDDRIVLEEREFDAVRRFSDFAAAALSSARMRDELDGYAYTDALTGLANRRRLEGEFVRRTDSRLALLLVDFDGLKAVNDTLSYDDGDQLIAAVASALEAQARPGELVARYGGDEFVVMIEDAGADEARRRADEITEVLDRLSLPPETAALFHGASIGWSTVEAGENASAALARAALEMRFRKRRRKTDRDLENGYVYREVGRTPEA